jgi:hypothetical protein
MSDERVRERLQGLGARTAGVRARPGFQARVMLAVARESTLLFSVELWRQARWFVPVALALTLGSVGAASFATQVTSSELAQAELELEAW